MEHNFNNPFIDWKRVIFQLSCQMQYFAVDICVLFIFPSLSFPLCWIDFAPPFHRAAIEHRMQIVNNLFCIILKVDPNRNCLKSKLIKLLNQSYINYNQALYSVDTVNLSSLKKCKKIYQSICGVFGKSIDLLNTTTTKKNTIKQLSGRGRAKSHIISHC